MQQERMRPRSGGFAFSCCRKEAKAPTGGAFLRADDGARTHDPQLGKLMLYQLSYVRAALIVARIGPSHRSLRTSSSMQAEL
jgi:hypothetical protein